MNCPKCGGVTRVSHVKQEAKISRRYRRCQICGNRFITEQPHERVVSARKNTIFSDAKVRAMRVYAKETGFGYSRVAAAFGERPGTVQDLLGGQTYKDVHDRDAG